MAFSGESSRCTDGSLRRKTQPQIGEQVVRRHREILLDHAIGCRTSKHNTRPDEDSLVPQAIGSLSAFREASNRFGKLSGVALPRSVSDLVLGDAYMLALNLSRQTTLRRAVRQFCVHAIQNAQKATGS